MKPYDKFNKIMDETIDALEKAVKHWQSTAKTYEELYQEAQKHLKK